MKEDNYTEENNTFDFEKYSWSDFDYETDDDSPEYASEDNRYQRELITSDSAKALVERIHSTTFSHRLKNAILGDIKSYFTRDAYLAFINNPDRVLLNLQYDVELGMLSASLHDKRKHELTQIKSLVVDLYPFIVSRSLNGLERDLQGKKRIEQRMGGARAYETPADIRRRRFGR